MQDDKTKEFLQKLKDSGNWNDDYDYSKAEYVDDYTKVIVIDKKFGTEHLISPKTLLKGAKCCINNLIGGFFSYEKAKEFVKKLNFSGQKSYHSWNDRPHFIPSNPSKQYKDNGWVSWGDYLSTGTISTQNMEYLPFEEARDFARSLGLSNGVEWKKYAKSKDFNILLPMIPNQVYKDCGYVSIGDWLGNGIIADQLKEYLPFEDARDFARSLNLKVGSEWYSWWKENKPNNIPSRPHKTYKDSGWLSMRDWLGNEVKSNVDKIFLPFEEARDFVLSLGFKQYSEWREYAKSNKRPNNIPHSPDSYYKEFISYADFLGYLGNGTHPWTKSYILDFIKSLQSELTNLDSVELITIINSNNLAKKIKEIGQLENLVSSTSGTQERERIVNEILNTFEESHNDEEEDAVIVAEDEIEFDDTLEEVDTYIITDEEEEELEPLNPIQELHMYDNNMVTASLDDENIDFLMKNQLKKLWNRVLNNKIDVSEFENETGGKRFNIIKNWFFEEYEELNNIEVPKDYIFKYQPNLMQKLITYRIEKEKRYGNWSGTGAGKTLSAIFAGRYAGAKNTLIICNNATVEGWVNSIHEYFTNNNVYTKRTLEYTDPKLYTVVDKYNVNFKKDDNNYFVLNYETFQQDDGEYVVSELLKNNVIDYIILDEVQNVKQRGEDESTRRNVINKLVIHSSEKNDDLLVMAMSATPVINNLTEPKKLIELLTGEIHNELETRENILNGIEMYKALTRHGLRYKPNYGISVNEEIIEVDGSFIRRYN